VAELLFYLLAAGTVGFGCGVIMAKLPMFSVLNLLGAFFCLAGIYLLSGFQFLAATQLLVYAGAIMVLFLFVIMLLNLSDEDELRRQGGMSMTGKRLGIAAAAAGSLALIGVFAPGVGETYVAPARVAELGIDHIPDIATVLFGRYVLAFEASSLLLLATMIGVMALAKRNRPGEEASETAQ
jgi:NADH-quinone oxidoreductase subunit J